jgi:predicted ATPase
MYISHVAIKNFRALDDIDCAFAPRINVIVGPNAVGKTTILNAVRLVTLLAPRTTQETLQVLISVGAASNQFPQQVFLNNLARDKAKDIEIRCTFSFSEEEISLLKSWQAAVVQNIVASQRGQNFANPATLIAFLQSPEGKQALADTSKIIGDYLERLDRERTLLLGVKMDPKAGQLSAYDPLSGPMVAFLDQRLPPSMTIFSYFPADRALPMGEVNLQLGGPDTQLQLESHNSQPQMKYQRLKNVIINALVIQGDNKDETVQNEFEKVFSGLLRGRRIKTIGINDLGLLSIMTEDIATGWLIELDSLSSGEKNIALTFLLVSRSVARGGIVLFDEPELHLNPAVSRDLLPFVMKHYSSPRNIQFLMCTHSPEILSGAFADEDCTLLHLKSASNITRVGKRALDEYADVLQQLGTSVVESLMYEGTVLVEGKDDVQFLQTGFSELVKRYNVTDRGGRREIEKTIARLKELEAKGERVSPIYLIFDKDEAPRLILQIRRQSGSFSGRDGVWRTS